MKHLKIILFLSLAIMSTQTIIAYDFMVNGLCYKINGSQSVTVTYQNNSSSSSYSNLSGAINIPAVVTYDGKTYSVTSIGNEAFLGCSGLTSVTIPNTVTSIRQFAFDSCVGLTSMIIPNSVTLIDGAFTDCKGLTSVTIGNSVTEIDGSSFVGCTKLETVTINSNALLSKNYYSSNLGNIFGTQVKQYIIGNSVTSIGDYAFYNCNGLTSVTIGNSVTSIGNGAFFCCFDLNSVTIPNSVTSIGENAFYYCTGLNRVDISDIAAWCNISWGNIYANPLIYAHNLYLNGNKVTDLIIPNSVTSIGKIAFSDCTGLTSVTIPNSVTTIGEGAFYNCSGLTRVNISDIAAWRNISFGDYYATPLPYAHNLYLNGNKVTNLVIPNGVSGIKNYAFYNCTGLTSVTIPNSVTSIGEYAFRYCTGLTSIYSLNPTPPGIGSYTFSETNYASATLYVPIGSKQAYNDAPYWKNFYNIIEKEYDGIDNVVIDPPVNPLENPDEIKSIYTIDGRSLNPQDISWLPNGLYIINGKKVLIKR